VRTPAIITRPVELLDKALLALEKKSSLAGISLLLATLLMSSAILYVGFSQLPVYHGIYYAELASDPFQAGNPNAYRILTPLFAYLVGLRGDRIIILNAIVALALVAIVYYFSRQRQYSPSLSLAVAAVLALTMPTLFTLFYGGYTDSTSYLLIFLMLVLSERPRWFWLLLLLGLLNRESVIFLLPFFLLLHWQSLRAHQKTRAFIKSTLYGLAGVFTSYFLFRLFISSRAAVKHSASFYLEPLARDPFYWLRQSAGAYPQGLFSAFKLCWILPLLALFYAARRRDYLTLLLIISPILCAAAQSLIAVDTSRMIAMSFPALLISVGVVRRETGDEALSAFMILLVALNLLVPQSYVTSNDIFPMR
jgi:hypothetical protein